MKIFFVGSEYENMRWNFYEKGRHAVGKQRTCVAEGISFGRYNILCDPL